MRLDPVEIDLLMNEYACQPNMNSLWGRVAVEELYRCGVRHFVVCPGSRSTPLVCAI